MLVTHKNCFDGSVACLLYMRHKLGHVEFIEPNEKVEINGNQEIFFVDVVPNNFLDFDTPRSVFIDHHVSNEHKLLSLKNAKVVFDVSKCGSELFYEFLGCPQSYSHIVRAAHVADLGIDLFNEYGLLHHIYGQQGFIKRFLSHTFINRYEKQIVLSKRMEIEDTARTVIKKGILVNDVFVGVCSKFESQVANIIKSKTGANLVVLINMDAGKLSLRSCDGSARMVAEYFGGGGHDDAAGCLIKPVFDNVIRRVSNMVIKARGSYAFADTGKTQD